MTPTRKRTRELAERTRDGTVTAPTVQLLAWIAEQSRSYAETIEAWKTSCPRLAVWEDALADDLVRVSPLCADRSKHRDQST